MGTMTKTKTIAARDAVTGMLLRDAVYPEFTRITAVRFSDAGIHTILELADGSTQYLRNHAPLEVADAARTAGGR